MERCVQAIAGFGALTLLMATLVSHLELTAQLPAFFAAHVSYWTSSRTIVGAPLEFVMALWFLAVAARRGPSELQSIDFLRFWSGVIVLALFVGLSYRVGVSCAPITVGGIAALCIVVDAAIRLHRLPNSVNADIREAVRNDLSILRRPQRLVRLIAAGAIIAIALQYLVYSGSGTTAADRDAQLARWFESEPRVTSADLVAPGRIRVVAFSDYQCPACSFQIPALEKTVKRYQMAGHVEVELVLRDFPLNADCNPSIATRLHPLACRAAVAARVAHRFLTPSQSEAFRNTLYGRHGGIAEADLVRELSAVQLLGKFNEHYAQQLRAVTDDAGLGGTLGVSGTPAVFVDGRLLRDAQPKVLSAILAHVAREVASRSDVAKTVEGRK